MCERADQQFFQEISESIHAPTDFVVGYDFASFSKDRKTKPTVIRELEIVGEASSRISLDKNNEYLGVPWRFMKDFRNVLAHEYFGVNEEIVWDIVKNKLPALKEQIDDILKVELSIVGKSQ